jgi:hypothetical protein
MTTLERQDWPGYSMMKDYIHGSKLIDREQQKYCDLANDEWALEYLKATVSEQYELICSSIERMRSSKNLSQAKISGFTNRVRGGIAFFNNSAAILSQLSLDLLHGNVQKQLSFLYSKNYEEFRTILAKFQTHFETHISMRIAQSNSNARFQFSHLSKLRNLIDALVSGFSATLGPLNIAFSLKLQPILDEREVFFRSQMANVAGNGRKVSELRLEMEEMMERQKRLEIGASDLDRMFEVLVMFKSSIGLEEEDDAISLLSDN